MSGGGWFEVVRRDGGWLARFCGGNGLVILSSTGQMYSSRANADRAVLLVAQRFDPAAVLVTPGVIAMPNGFVIEVRHSDERTTPDSRASTEVRTAQEKENEHE